MYDGLKNLEVPRRSHPRARRFVRIGLVALAIFGLLLAGTAFAVYRYVNQQLERGVNEDIRHLEAVLDESGALNILILGSDRRDVVDPGERKRPEFRNVGGGQRADVIILLHLSADKKKAVMVHFPRDLRVPIPGRSGFHKINSAYAFGGANLMIQTVKEFSGLPINHYVEVNFSSFRRIVDAVGGVNICVNRKLRDRRSGLDIPKAGCHLLEGDQSLAFVRARYIDPTADLGRIQRQQLFIRALMRKVKSVGFILDIPKVVALAKAVGKGVQYDKGVNLSLGRAIANRLAGFDQKRIDFRVVPGGPRYMGGVSYVVPNQEQARALFAAIEADATLPDYGKTGQSVPKRKDVTIRVLNGTGTAGLATRTAASLREEGFEQVLTGNTKKRPEQTTILFNPGLELKAQLVQREFPGAVVQVARKQQSTDIVVILGPDVLEPEPSPS